MAVFRCVLAGASLLALVASGCAKAKAETVTADGPPLMVPAPPPRQVAAAEPLTPEPEAPPPLAPAPPPVAATTPPPAPAAPAASPVRPATRKPETEITPPETPPETTRTPRDLRPAPSADAAAEERRVIELIARATKDLARVNYQGLSPEGRAQYEQSKRFADQAESAVKDRNLPFAQTLADKAATLAAGLLSR